MTIPLSFADAAYEVLKEGGRPLSPDEITYVALSEELILTEGKTPSATMSARLYVDVRDKGGNSRFTKEGKGKFGLREWFSLPPSPLPPRPREHDELIQKMREVGIATGRVVLTEYKAPYRYDVALAKNEYQSPDMVVEICDKGNVDKDFSSLNWARQGWNAKGLLITVVDRDFGKAQVVVGNTSGIHVMKAEDLRKLHALIGPENVYVLKMLFQ